MDVRRVDISHFRGIQHLSWRIPKGMHFCTLIGPGDSGKSTILTAMDMALSDRWSLSFSDSDFFQCDIENPIIIRVALSDLPSPIRQHDLLGMALCGIDDEGELYEDPEDVHDACVVIELKVDKTLEPIWTVYRPDKPEPTYTVSTAARRLIGTYKVDERVDNHLRWSRTSALARVTEAKHGTNELLLTANREARNAVSNAVPSELSELVRALQERIHTLGGGDFKDLKPGLDQSLSSSTGNLALYEGPIPLTNFGLGSRRLTGLAAQQLANADKGILLIDEIEYGLEPHRLVNLLGYVKDRTTLSLALVTTHSPTALRHVAVENLAIVRRDPSGRVTVKSFSQGHNDLQKLLRSSPEAFLARRVVLVEGATEYGFVLELVQGWNRDLLATGDPSSGALGVEIVQGSGSETIEQARLLASLGYDVVLFMDSDVKHDCAAADALRNEGVVVIRWQKDFRLERAVTDALNEAELTALIDKAVELSDDPSASRNNYLTHLRGCGLPEGLTTLSVNEWIGAGVDLNTARNLVAEAAHKYKWFKQVHKGRQLATLVLGSEGSEGSDTALIIQRLREAIFASLPPENSAESELKGPTEMENA